MAAPKKKAASKATTKAKKAPKPPRKKRETTKVPEASDYLAQLRAMKGTSEEDFAMFDDPLAWTSSVSEFLPTGSLALDRLIGGGWPVGRTVEVASWESVGKTTLLDQSIAHVQRMGGVAALIDSEQARDKPYSITLGVNEKELILAKALTVEEGFEKIEEILAVQEAYVLKLEAKKLRPPPMLIVWDSLGGTPTNAEYQGKASDKHMADSAKRIKLNLRRLSQRLAQIRASLVFANHFYQDIGPFASLKTSGGSGIRYYTSLRVWLSRTGNLKIGETVVGHTVEAKIKKTRITKPRPPAELGLVYGAGFFNAYSLFEWGKKNGLAEHSNHRWVVQSGAWSYLFPSPEEHIAFQQTFVGLGDVFKERPEVYEAMVRQYMQEGE